VAEPISGLATLPKPAALSPARSRAGDRLSARVRRNASAHGFLIGAVLCFAFFSWYPMCREIVMSFQKTRLGVTSWAGWANYERIFHDPTFWTAWKNTLEFTVLALIIGYAVPFLVAILLNELRHAKGYLRCLVYLPVMLPPTSALLLFAYFYDPSYGLFNDVLRHLHLPVSTASGSIPPRCWPRTRRCPGPRARHPIPTATTCTISTGPGARSPTNTPAGY